MARKKNVVLLMFCLGILSGFVWGAAPTEATPPDQNASDQPIELQCGGTMFQYEPQIVEGVVPFTATTVDLTNYFILTPVGNFRIYKVESTNIYFDDPRSQYKVFGSLDRLTGKIAVFWRRPEEEAKLQAGLSARMSMYAELTCTLARRLF